MESLQEEVRHQDPGKPAKPLRSAGLTTAAGKRPEVTGSSETHGALDTILGHRVLSYQFQSVPSGQHCAGLRCSGFSVDLAFRNPVRDVIVNKKQTHTTVCGHQKS